MIKEDSLVYLALEKARKISCRLLLKIIGICCIISLVSKLGGK